MKFIPLLIFCTVFSGCISLNAKYVEKIEVIEIPNVKKDRLYIRINEWLVQHFFSAKAVIQFQDKEAGVIMGYYSLTKAQNVNDEPPRPFIKIEMKDERARITFFADIPFFDTPLLGEKQKWPYGSDEIVKAKWTAEIEALKGFLTRDEVLW